MQTISIVPIISRRTHSPPDIAVSIAVGLLAVVREFSESSGLAEDLTTAFGSTDAALVLDLAAYMVSRESAVMQHFPAWAREHRPLFPGTYAVTAISVRS